MTLSRRAFLGFLAAPAIVRVASLMPVKAVPAAPVLMGIDLAQPGSDRTIIMMNNPDGSTWINRLFVEAAREPDRWSRRHMGTLMRGQVSAMDGLRIIERHTESG